MNDRTWPHRSETSHFSTLPFPIKNPTRKHQNPTKNHEKHENTPSTAICLRQFRSPATSRRSDHHRDFAALPNDVLTKIAANFSLPNLQTASLVCKAWRDGLRPLREAMLFLRWGKRFKHGRGGVKVSMEKALDSFLKGAARGSTLAMVDAGLVYWEMGRKEEGVALYRRAAELGDPAGQCNLGISYLQAEPPNVKEAVKWLYQASVGGYVRAQYQLALCLHRGIGTDQNLSEAARWYLRAAVGGYVRAMYNVSLCYSLGKGFIQNHRQSRKWMKLAADHGHRKAQFEHGLTLFSEGQMMKAVVYLELAGRGGETAAVHVKNVILQQLSPPSRERALTLADNWRALPSTR
ncbi:putative F-box domain, tetratricopeptide-like helical domain superfamily [Helianthus annuus]|nr:putative F-box domain, tetratricopeptide-like helical domain superfamily [Helianthus annuus]KAJ0717673.1 putative F-box domain, tetratricopeptide-like helical domain superfamily [Helianthus annuus]KAJ0895921.1 putative F-box domain, tetratricopeptide-like helical domain superfamily [Helianthus annuus]KAJ0899954.1 putative F-box domain, tetratricopeptide-like helical domain superfamily [Helianthus annuus]